MRPPMRSACSIVLRKPGEIGIVLFEYPREGFLEGNLLLTANIRGIRIFRAVAFVRLAVKASGPTRLGTLPFVVCHERSA